DHPTATPPTPGIVAGPVAGTGVYFLTAPGTIESGYDSWWGIALTRDLTTLTEVGGAGTIAATDDDIVHVWMMTSHPQLMAEIRLYVVISTGFAALVLPA